MNFKSCDSLSELFDYPIESPVTPTCDFQNDGELLSECTMIDRYGCDHLWSNDDKVTPLDSKLTLSSVVIPQDKPEYGEQSPSLSCRETKSSNIPQSELLVTKTNHFLCKDDFLWKYSKELPDNILVSPRKENTPAPDSIENTFLNFDSEKDNLNFDFERDFLSSIQVENESEEAAVNSDTKVDVEFLDNLLNGFSDQPQNFDTDTFMKTTNNDFGSSDPSSFNEISCNIIQQDMTTETKSAIKTLLKDTSFKGNFHMKKSTEILSEIDQSHDSFAEHNYFSPTKVSKPRPSKIDSDNPYDSTNGIVPAASSPVQVPILVEDFAVETVISSTSTASNNSLNLKTPAVVLSRCETPASAPSSKSIKPRKKVNKKPVICKTDPDPTYKPNTRRRKPVKKSTSPKNKLNANPSKKLVAPVAKFDTCGIAQLPKIPTKSTADTKPKTVESNKSERSRIPAIKVPKAAPQVPKTSSIVGTSPKIDPTPVRFADPSTPLASPTKYDILDHELTDKDSSQPETVDSNVDTTADSTPKIEKKKISLKEYLKNRAPKTITDPEPTPEPTKSITMAPIANVEEILRTIVKPAPLQIDDVLKTIAKSTPIPVIKSDPIPAANKPALVANKPAPVANKPAPVANKPAPVVKSEPVSKPAKILKTCEPKKELIRKRDEINHKKPATKPQRNPTIVSKPVIQPVNNAPLKLVKVVIPERVPSIRPHSVSPNEVSQQSSDSCDRYSSSGFSSYHNSSVSSTCGSPYPGHDDKSNDTKYSYSEKIDTSKQRNTEKKELQIPFAVNKELLREDDRSSKYKYRRDRHRRSDSITRKRKYSDSCFEDDSDSSDYSGRKRSRSRKRYVSSSSSSSSDKSHHYRSHNAERSTFRDRKYPNAEIMPEPYCYNFNELPNAFYPSVIPIPWHPSFGPLYPAYAPSMEVPYFFNGYHDPGMEVGGNVEVQSRALFVGNIVEEVSEKSLHKRFSKFGKIEYVRIHNRDPKNVYAFVYYKDKKYVQAAIQHGNDDPTLPHYKLGVGIRKDRYADRRPFTYDKATIPITNFQTPCYQERKDTYSLKLEQMKNDLKQNTLDSRYK